MVVDEVGVINDSIKLVIFRVRELLFREVLFINSKIIDGLKGFGFDYFEDLKRDQIFLVFR